MPYLDLDRIRLFRTDHGNAASPEPALLLVHGWGGDGGQWAPLLPHIGVNARRLIVPDLRGHGASRSQWTETDWRGGAVREDDFTPRALADDLARLLAACDVGPVVAVGHSMGGQIVTALAVEHPHAVDALIVLDPAYGADDAEMARIPGEQEALRREGSDWAAGFVAGAFSPNADPALLERERRLMATTDARVLAAARDAMYLAADSFGADRAARAYLARCRHPTLAVYSTDRAAQWHRTCVLGHQDIAIETIPGVGHYLHVENPGAVGAVITRWLAARDRSGKGDCHE